MDWQDVPEIMDAWVEKLAEPAWLLRRQAVDLYTQASVGFYIDPRQETLALQDGRATAADLARCKTAAARVGQVRDELLTDDELADPYSTWIKVAHSPTLRSLGEALNFFPGQYPGGIPNHPSPLAAMLTSGLLGAGLGWGAGHLGKALLPTGFGDNLPRTGLMLGGALGAAPGAVWAGTNKLLGHGVNDPRLLDGEAGAPPQMDEDWLQSALPHELKSAMDRVVFSERFLKAAEFCVKKAFGDTFADTPLPRTPTLMDVNINHLGQVLYDNGATEPLTAAALGTMYAAQQMPSRRAMPGYATGDQLGMFASAAGAGLEGYAMGLPAGALINAVIGTPWSAPAIAGGAAALGVVGSVISRLLGG